MTTLSVDFFLMLPHPWPRSTSYNQIESYMTRDGPILVSVLKISYSVIFRLTSIHNSNFSDFHSPLVTHGQIRKSNEIIVLKDYYLS